MSLTIETFALYFFVTIAANKKSKLVENENEDSKASEVKEIEVKESAKKTAVAAKSEGSNPAAKAWKMDASPSVSVNSSVADDDEEDDETKEMQAQFGGADELEDEEAVFKEEQDEESAIIAASKTAGSAEVRALRQQLAIWEKGKPVPYLALSRAFREIHLTRSKLRHVEVMREFFRAVLERTPSELVTCIYLASNKLAPQFEGVELGIGDMIMQKAIMEATGKSLKNLRAEYKKIGDLGLIAQASIKSIRTLVPPKPLTVTGVFDHLRAIAAEKGNSSQKRKQDRIRTLLVACKEYESMYIIKALQGKMRINLGPKSVIAGLAHAFAYYEANGAPSDALLARSNKLVRAAFARRPDWAVVVKAVLEKGGLEKLPETCQLTIGVPVEPMLAQPTNGIEAILQRLQGHDTFTAEYKYDGERAQVHLLPNGTVKIYSRNLEDNTGRFPDIIARLPNCYINRENTKSFILDCEAVAYDLAADKILPYQVLSTRSRKDVAIETIKVCSLWTWEEMKLQKTFAILCSFS